MSDVIHIANTDVEFEYADATACSLESSWQRYSLCLQLQFLPLLYAVPTDQVAVTAMPSPDYLSHLQKNEWLSEGLPNLTLLNESSFFKGKSCRSWGPSLLVEAWAQAHQVDYERPKNWHVICQVNSKAYSFQYSTLKNSALFKNEQELLEWVAKFEGPKVLKTCFGLSGKGNKRINQREISSALLAFCQKEWMQGRPIIGEPWLNRDCDFSTQWLIHADKKIEYRGATCFETDSHGTYCGTLAGPEDVLFDSKRIFLQEHQKIARIALQDMAEKGFFGAVGIDAMLYYDEQGNLCLYPIVEINARQTMSLVALLIQQRFYPQLVIRLAFTQHLATSLSLLPLSFITSKGKLLNFRRHLTFEVLTDIPKF